jgi:hypothetical protein
MVNPMSTRGRSRISMVETNLPGFALQGHTYAEASERLRDLDFEVFYECRTSILSPGQRGLYDVILSKLPNDLKVFLDPIIVSFVLRDACDISEADYVWLDLEEGEEVGCSAWLKREDQDAVLDEALYLLGHHLEKYVIDAYDRRTRDDMLRVWEAQLDLQECVICGDASPSRRVLAVADQKLRGWICSTCGHRTVLHSDVLALLRGRAKPV